MLLDELATKYGTDKGIWGYLPHYTRELEHRRHEVTQVLEIGICGQRDIPNNVTGASLWMWHDYFPKAHVHGIDIDPRWMLQADRISSYLGDQRDPKSLQTIAEHGAPFDLIVDDAIHDPDVQLVALHALLPFLKPDGLYVIEDVCPYKLPAGDIRIMTAQVPHGYSCEVIKTHKPEVLLFIKKDAAPIRELSPSEQLEAARNMEADCTLGAGAGFGKYTSEISERRRNKVNAELASIGPVMNQEEAKEVLDWIGRGMDRGEEPTRERPLLGLVMIVKNEARRIAQVLASYLPYIDAWTVLDTGSTDGTQDIIRRELASIPGALHEELFVDFATSRNRALELHGQASVFTIMPNGDVLQGGPELRAFLDVHRGDRAGAYRVRISPGHYYHPLVMRAGGGWHYKWRTHECAVGPNVGAYIPGVTVVRDRGTRTDEEWRQRWTRDLDLLNRDREDDPSDPRPYFYLGQTYECLGRHAEALAMFERRAELGGYFDEVYEAKFRIAKMKDKLGRSWAIVQQAYLDAYLYDPRRAEPLYAIAEYWHDEDQHALTRIFATVAAKIPKPSVDLFLDEAVYRWKAADLAAISSFYTGYRDDGRRFADQAVKANPNDERLRANRAFYAQSAKELFGASARAIDFQLEPGWNASNPSIYRHLNRLRCIVRTVNYKIVKGAYVTPDGDGVIRTRNFLLDLGGSLNTISAVEMIDKTGEERTRYPIHGFEDARLFSWKGKWWATATVCDFTEDGRREIALLEIDDDGAIVSAEPLRGAWSGEAQKNWMPLIDGDVARLIYATCPTRLFELISTGERHTILHATNTSYAHGRLRGGSQAVRVDDGWLFIVHDVAFPGSGRMYLHRFVRMNERFEVVAMSEPFYFEKLGIEFCAGLAIVGDKLVASYAINDGAARFGTFDFTAVRESLCEDFTI